MACVISDEVSLNFLTDTSFARPQYCRSRSVSRHRYGHAFRATPQLPYQNL